MARAIVDRRPHRANGDVALHVLAVMAGILEAATAGRRAAISRTCERPAPLGEADARMLLKTGPRTGINGIDPFSSSRRVTASLRTAVAAGGGFE
jgi:hypothetical protein